MKCVYPITAGCLCARMSRGFNGQDATGDLIVVLATSPNSESANIYMGGVSSTLMARDYKSAKDVVVDSNDAVVYPGVGITSAANQSNPQPGDPAPTLSTDSRNYLVEKVEKQTTRKYIVRRLTPTECLRLQGLPDWWCDGANGSDSAVYKIAGNGIAIPCAYDVLNHIAEELRGEL